MKAESAEPVRVRELLALYQRALDTVDELPLIPLVLRRHGGWPRYTPRLRILVRFFVIRHIHGTLEHVSRRLSARAALGIADHGEEQDREAVRQFQESLPPNRRKFHVLLLIGAIVVVAQPILMTGAPALLRGLVDLTPTEIRDRLDQGLDKLVDAAMLSISSLYEALEIFFAGEPLIPCAILVGLAMSTYVVLRPIIPAFGLARMVFNATAEPTGCGLSGTLRWSAGTATGVYACERRVLAEFGSRPTREFPLDLGVHALAMLFPMAFGALMFQVALLLNALELADIACAATLLLVVAIRLLTLYRRWRRRATGTWDPELPYEVGCGEAQCEATVARAFAWRHRLALFTFILMTLICLAESESDSGITSRYLSPLLIGFGYSVVVFWLLSLPWWYRIRRELRDLDRVYGFSRSSVGPALSVLAMASGWSIVPLIRTGAQLRRAQTRAGVRPMVCPPWLLPAGLLLPPLLFAYLQRELNRLWTTVGVPLDPTPVGSAGIYPWLKTARAGAPPSAPEELPELTCMSSTPPESDLSIRPKRILAGTDTR